MAGLFLHGSVVFEAAGAVFRFSSVMAPIELHDDGVRFVSASFVDLVPWEAVRELRGWAPVLPEDRAPKQRDDENSGDEEERRCRKD